MCYSGFAGNCMILPIFACILCACFQYAAFYNTPKKSYLEKAGFKPNVTPSMDQVLERKINLLVRLANADGHFDVTEKAFIKDLLEERGVDHHELNEALASDSLKDLHTIVDKEQALYWALQLMKADGILHPDEITFCKTIAFRLKFLPAVVDAYMDRDMPVFNVFKQEVGAYRTFIPQPRLE
jgi:uncharacterized membrane protein YebE (DUF533 family)